MLMLTIGTTSVLAQTNITSLSQITDANGSYVITQDISVVPPALRHSPEL